MPRLPPISDHKGTLAAPVPGPLGPSAHWVVRTDRSRAPVCEPRPTD